MTQRPGESPGSLPPQAFGAILRDARLRLGRTVEDAERQTRILAQHLVALEAGEFERLPPGIYARGFVHNYANYLQLNPQEMVRLFIEARGEVETFYRPQPVARPVNTGGPISPNFVVIVFVVGMLAVVTAWGYTLLVQPPPPLPIASEPTVAAATPTGIVGRTVSPPASAVVGAGGTTAPASVVAPSATPATAVRVTLRATGDAYYIVTVDGMKLKEGTMRAGEAYDIPPGKSVKVYSGKPSNITYAVNGQDRGVLPNEAYRNMATGGFEITLATAATPPAAAATPTVVRRN